MRDAGHANGHALEGFDREPDAWRSTVESRPTPNPAQEDVDPAYGLQFPDDITDIAQDPDVIKHIVAPGDLAALYGPSGSGKTFVATMVGYMVATGAAFAGRRTTRSAVLWVCLEGGGGAPKRMKAAQRAYGPAGYNFSRLTLPVRLDRANSAKGANVIVKACKRQEGLSGHPVRLVIVDTLARAMSPDDENASQDMGAVVSALADISRRTGAAVLVVHHSGKDVSRGMRGSSALFAACDAVIEVTSEGELKLEKCKDGETGPIATFKLIKDVLGTDADGDDITTCHVELISEGHQKRPPKVKLTTQVRRALAELQRLYDEGAAKDVPPSEIGLDGIAEHSRPRVVSLNEWRDKCYSARLVTDGKQASERKAFGRAAGQLEDARIIARHADFVWLLGQKRRPGHAGTWRDMVATSRSGERDGQGHTPIGVSVCPASPASLPDASHLVQPADHAPLGQHIPSGSVARPWEEDDGEVF